MKRTDDLLRRIISETLLSKVQDPRIGLVTVTRVQVSREFDTAKVWVSVYGNEEARAESLEGLRSAAPFLQQEISREIRLRRIPRLKFFYDDSLDRGFRIREALLGIEPGTVGEHPATPSDPEPAAPEEGSDDSPGR